MLVMKFLVSDIYNVKNNVFHQYSKFSHYFYSPCKIKSTCLAPWTFTKTREQPINIWIVQSTNEIPTVSSKTRSSWQF